LFSQCFLCYCILVLYNVSVSVGLFQDPQAQKEEQQKFGIYYEDDYDYLQHLKDVSEFKQTRMAPVGI
jgi:hypothetical protein